MDTPPRDRIRALDGLRGLACVIVLLHHSALVIPWFAQTYFASDVAAVGSTAWWLAYTPLKVATAGAEAVIVFFVLSGFVLALRPLARPDFDWLGYFPQRMVRLYLPVIGSVVLAAALALIVPRHIEAVTGEWLVRQADPVVSFASVARESSILFAQGFMLNGPLWSLIWEVWFSLLLPAFLALVLLFRRAWWVAVVLGVVLSFAGAVLVDNAPDPMLQYLPVFLIGVGMARGIDDLAQWGRRLSASRLGEVGWWLLLAIALTLLVLGWLLRGIDVVGDVTLARNFPTAPIGAALLVFCAACWPRASRLLETRPLRWLGRISFSLYLVHVPVLLGFAFAIGDANWQLALLLGMPAAVLAAWGFTLVVEAPSHRLSRRIGANVQRPVRT